MHLYATVQYIHVSAYDRASKMLFSVARGSAEALLPPMQLFRDALVTTICAISKIVLLCAAGAYLQKAGMMNQEPLEALVQALQLSLGNIYRV